MDFQPAPSKAAVVVCGILGNPVFLNAVVIPPNPNTFSDWR